MQQLTIRRAWPFLLLLHLVGNVWAGDGVVEGRVLTMLGQPVPAARVAAKPRGVVLAAALRYVEVDATVGPKAAVVTGIVVDDANGTLVRPTIHLWRQNTPEDGVRISLPPKFRLLVPPDEDIGFELEAEDHEAWTFPGPLHLQSGSTLNLEVRVRAKAPQ